MKVIIGGDHTSIEYRQKIIKHLKEKGIEVVDVGSDEEVSNYASIGIVVAEIYLATNADFGIAICGTGVGISIAANKVNGIRAALATTPEIAKLTRLHNDANILAIGARIISLKTAIEIVDNFIETEFEGERHQVRLNTIKEFEQNQ